MRRGVLAMGVSLLLWGAVLAPGVEPASATPSHLLDEVGAMARAKASSKQVEVTALTDGRRLVVADPTTGTFKATLTAAVVRVPNGQGGWTPVTPSGTLGSGDSTRSSAGPTSFRQVTYGPGRAPTRSPFPAGEVQVGWNGWTGPHYESEVYYRFETGALQRSGLRSVTFIHENTYSALPTTDCVQSTGHPIEVGVTDWVEGAITAANRPAFQGPTALNDYGVGSADACTSVQLNWDMLAAFQASMPAGQDVTLAMRGKDPTDKYNWRSFSQVFGAGSYSRPLLSIEYVLPPDAPQQVGVSSMNLLGTSDHTYVNSTTQTVVAVLPAASGQCKSGPICLAVRFELWDEAGTTKIGEVTTPTDGSGYSVQAILPELTPGVAYQVRAYTLNEDYGLESATYASLSPSLMVSTIQAVPPVATVSATRVVTGTSVTVHAETTTDAVAKWCLGDQTVFSPSQLKNCVTTTATSVDFVTAPLVLAGRGGLYTFIVWVQYQDGRWKQSNRVSTVVVSQ